MHLKNILALAVAGSRSDPVDAVLRMGNMVGGPADVPVPGRGELAAPRYAAMAIGLAAHLDDFDDTHLTSIIHPSASTVAAAFSSGTVHRIDGSRFLHAFALGCEVQLRVGTAMSPRHYDAGWHATGTCGVLGAATAAAIACDSSPSTIASSLALAANSTIGHRETFGTPIKPFHPGKAAANGMLAVELAAAGTVAPEDSLIAFLGAMAPGHEAGNVLDRFGEHWEFMVDMVKPYPCGLVIHPVIDAGIAAAASGVRADEILGLRLRAHPLVVDLTNIRDPQDGLQARFSAVHGLAAALVDGAVDLDSYEPSRLNDEEVSRLRDLTIIDVDPECAADAVTLTVTLKVGGTRTFEILHARGSEQVPLTPAEVDRKVDGLLRPTLGENSGRMPTAVNDLPGAASLSELEASLLPADGGAR